MKTIEEICAEIEADRARKGEEEAELRTVLAAAMMAAGVTRVTISFSGSGDSGCVDGIIIAMAPGHERPQDLKDQLGKWFDMFTESTNVDWWNNDGGYGEVTFDLATTPPKFTASISQYETISEEVYNVEEAA